MPEGEGAGRRVAGFKTGLEGKVIWSFLETVGEKPGHVKAQEEREEYIRRPERLLVEHTMIGMEKVIVRTFRVSSK